MDFLQIMLATAAVVLGLFLGVFVLLLIWALFVRSLEVLESMRNRRH